MGKIPKRRFNAMDSHNAGSWQQSDNDENQTGKEINIGTPQPPRKASQRRKPTGAARRRALQHVPRRRESLRTQRRLSTCPTGSQNTKIRPCKRDKVAEDEALEDEAPEDEALAAEAALFRQLNVDALSSDCESELSLPREDFD